MRYSSAFRDRSVRYSLFVVVFGALISLVLLRESYVRAQNGEQEGEDALLVASVHFSNDDEVEKESQGTEIISEGLQQLAALAGEYMVSSKGVTLSRAQVLRIINRRLEAQGYTFEELLKHPTARDALREYVGETMYQRLLTATGEPDYEPEIIEAPADFDVIESAPVDVVETLEEGTAKTIAKSLCLPAANIFVVDSESGADTNDGSDWNNAFATIQAAIEVANDNGGQVWVAAGSYESVTMSSNVEIYGGFPSGGGCWEERSRILHPSIIRGSASNAYASGIVNATLDGFWLGETDMGLEIQNTDETVTFNDLALYRGTLAPAVNMTNSDSILSNIIITCFVSFDYASGVRINGGAPTLENCVIAGNVSVACNNPVSAVAVELSNGAAPIIRNCTIVDNAMESGVGGIGVADLSNVGGSVENSILWNNRGGNVPDGYTVNSSVLYGNPTGSSNSGAYPPMHMTHRILTGDVLANDPAEHAYIQAVAIEPTSATGDLRGHYAVYQQGMYRLYVPILNNCEIDHDDDVQTPPILAIVLPSDLFTEPGSTLWVTDFAPADNSSALDTAIYPPCFCLHIMLVLF